MNEDTDQAKQIGELLAQSRLRGEQLDRVESRLEAHATKVEQKVAEQAAQNHKTHTLLVSHLGQVRGLKWAVGLMVPILAALGVDWWQKGG